MCEEAEGKTIMTYAVWKFPIPVEDEFSVDMPAGSQLLHFRTQYETPTLWALVNPHEQHQVSRRFRLAGTGHPINVDLERLNYIGTCVLMNGALVFHLFEIIG